MIDQSGETDSLAARSEPDAKRCDSPPVTANATGSPDPYAELVELLRRYAELDQAMSERDVTKAEGDEWMDLDQYMPHTAKVAAAAIADLVRERDEALLIMRNSIIRAEQAERDTDAMLDRAIHAERDLAEARADAERLRRVVRASYAMRNHYDPRDPTVTEYDAALSAAGSAVLENAAIDAARGKP